MRMNWEQLFCDKRERESKTEKLPYRNCFDMDYDRIVYSSSLRRLQDKAQVFPLQENDFTRTRLTHSLEVSAIGKSIGANVGFYLREKGTFNEDQEKKLQSLLLVAGLVHDLGNPPFGHYGEDIIKEWFKKNNNKLLNKNLTQKQLNDFIHFDGNAQTIRILSRLQFLNDKYGMNFCYGTLSALMKYPWSSSNHKNSNDKFGYFISEKKFCKKIIKETGILNRNPVTFLLEAADDIAYLFADLEDALKKYYVPLNDFFNAFKIKAVDHEELKSFIDIINKKRETNNKKNISAHERDIIDMQNFKILGQGFLIKAVCKEFIEQYDSIMEGNYKNKCLLDCNKTKDFVEFIRKNCISYAYQNKEVLSLELVGKEVIENLLNKFIFAVLDEDHYMNSKYANGKLYSLISENFKFIQYYNKKGEYDENKLLIPYERIQIVIDFISGMTDSYALNLHKKLLGMRL